MGLFDIFSSFHPTPLPTPAPTHAPAPEPKLMDITPAVKALAPKLSAQVVDRWCAALIPEFVKAGVTTQKRIAAFLGQVAVESADFTALTENLYYTAPRLCAVWPSRFPNAVTAAPYAGEPEKLANHVYAGRMGNGDEATGDGWMFRGGGLIDLTGRATYTLFAQSCGKTVEEASDWVRTIEGAAASAVWFWSSHELNALADTWSIQSITEKVNGGLTDLATRVANSNIALRALGG